MAMVAEMYVGNTHIMCFDDYYKDKTPEQVEEILAETARIAQAAFTAQAERERQAAEAKKNAE